MGHAWKDMVWGGKRARQHVRPLCELKDTSTSVNVGTRVGVYDRTHTRARGEP